MTHLIFQGGARAPSDKIIYVNALPLARVGERWLLAALRQDVDLREPSLLPGWTRAHLVAHLIGNAGALGNLLRWARTGVETPMYASRAARADQIDRYARRPAEWLLEEFRGSSNRLAAAMADLQPEHWASEVRSAPDRTITAAEVPWLRCRESFVHLVDLDVGVRFADLPAEFLIALLDDATGTVGAKPGCPPVRLVAGARQWSLGVPPCQREVSGTPAELAGWVTGRVRVDTWPTLPVWL